jgi:hypothetical protein
MASHRAAGVITGAVVLFCIAAVSREASAEGDGVANPSGNQVQPQGWTGPTNTQSGGAPAESPQGQSPPGMQAAPQGSDKPITTDQGGVPDGSPKN